MFRLVTASLLSFLLVAANSAAAVEPLDAFPDDALLVVRAASLEKLLGGVNDLVEAAGPAARPIAAYLNNQLPEALQLPGGLDALDGRGPIHVAVLSLPQNAAASSLAWLVRPKDEVMLRRAMLGLDSRGKFQQRKRDDGFIELRTGKRVCYVKRHGEDVLYAFSEAVLSRLARAETKSFAAILDAPARKAFHAGQAAVAVNAPRLVRRYRGDIAAAKKQIVGFINSLAEEDLGVPNAEVVKRLYLGIVAAVFTGIDDAACAVLRFDLSGQGGGATARVSFNQASATQKLLAAHPADPLESLELLPAGAPMYFGMKLNYGDWGEVLQRSNYGDDPLDPQAAAAALKQMRRAGVQTAVSSMSIPREFKFGMVTTTFEQAKDAQELRRGWGAFLTAMREVKSPIISQQFKYQAKAEQHKKRDIDLFEIRFKLETDDAEAAALLEKFFGKLFGGMTLETRVATLDNLLVQTTGNHPKFIQAVLDGLSSGKGLLGLERRIARPATAWAGEPTSWPWSTPRAWWSMRSISSAPSRPSTPCWASHRSTSISNRRRPIPACRWRPKRTR